MKRLGGVIERAAERDNLLLAFHKAAKGARASAPARAFQRHLEAHVRALRAGLLEGTLQPEGYSSFEIRDPKPRRIHAPTFRDRVLHHALLNVCEPRFESWQIHDSYACRKGKGTWAAIERAQQFARRAPWVLKMDVRHCFETIPHRSLEARLARLFKDRALLGLFGRILAGHQAAPGRGLPIGALTSQHFANAYLGALDHHVQAEFRPAGYLRYMDDFLLFGDSKAELRRVYSALAAWVTAELELELKPAQLHTTERGVPFLGYRVAADHLRLTSARKRRHRAAVRAVVVAYARGELDEYAAGVRCAALCAHAARARTRGMRQRLMQSLAAAGWPV